MVEVYGSTLADETAVEDDVLSSVLLAVSVDEMEGASLNELVRVSNGTATTVEVESVVVSVLAAIVAVDSGSKVSETAG